MKNIIFTADSCIELDESEINERDMHISKFSIAEFYKTYSSGQSREFPYDLSQKCKTDFYERLENGGVFRTAGLGPYNASEMVAWGMLKTSDVIYFCVSSKLSGTYINLKPFFDECQNLKIKPYIFDTLNASIGINQLLLLAEKLRNDGASFVEIKKALRAAKKKVDVYFFTNNLHGIMICRRVKGDYPIHTTQTEYAFCLKDGLMRFKNKSINTAHAINKMCAYVKENIDENNDAPIIIGVASRSALAKELEARLANLFPNREIMIKQVSVPTASHVGFGVLGVSFFKK